MKIACYNHFWLMYPVLVVFPFFVGAGYTSDRMTAEPEESNAGTNLPKNLEIRSPDEFIQEVLEDSTPAEPDYEQVVSDALRIAEEIDRRLIEQLMGEASENLSVYLPAQGYPKARKARDEMEGMINFCKGGGGKAAKACKFKLKIQMNMDPGNTLNQFSKGHLSGVGSGTGFGENGQGAAGMSGGQSQFALYGPDQFGRKSSQSRRIGDKKNVNSRLVKDESDSMARNVEELATGEDSTIEINAEGQAGIMEEYRGLITDYFKELAEEEK